MKNNCARHSDVCSLCRRKISDTHPKFDYFYYYYKTPIRYDNNTFDVYINVARAKNDKSNHFYELNHWTQNEKEKISAGLIKSIPISTKSSPDGAGWGIAHINRVSKKSISQNSSVVNTNLENSDDDTRKSYVGIAYLTEERVERYLKDYAIPEQPNKSQ